MNYELIKDTSELNSFIDWLPELQKRECYYVILIARNKYSQNLVRIPSGRQTLNQFTANKNNLYNKIKQLECELGSYKIGSTSIPQEALAVYINVNPRDNTLATKKLMRQSIDLIVDANAEWNIAQEAFSSLQTSCKRKLYVNVDLDDIELIDVQNILIEKDLINLDSVSFLTTRGGVHLLIEYAKIKNQYKSRWYKSLHDQFTVDAFGDEMIPIPGTYQGGFTPKLILYNEHSTNKLPD